MRALHILVLLFALTSTCHAQQSAPMSFVRLVGEYPFRIPSPAFFEQLNKQFCAKATTDVCERNLGKLSDFWIFFDSTLLSKERQRAEKPMALVDIVFEQDRYEQLKEQTNRFVETEGESMLTESMRPRILGQ